MENTFSFLNLKSNDDLSHMKYDDAVEFIRRLREYKLALRDTLGLDENLTFGLEIEFENLIFQYNELICELSELDLLPSTFYSESNLKSLSDYKKKNKLWDIGMSPDKYLDIDPKEVFNWSVSRDLSLNNGAEITSPILVDKAEHWKDLKTVCDLASKFGEISTHSAGHVHVGTQVLGAEKKPWLNFLRLWSAYENVIYRFGYNEYLTKHKNISYCKPISKMIFNAYAFFGGNFDRMLNYLSDSRSYAVNFQNVTLSDGKVIPFSTLEFRNPNGTLDPVIWQNNVNFFIKLLRYCKSDRFNEDNVNYRLKQRNKYSNDFESYNHIFTEQAIELADMIFNNNLDKIYFLRQYIKDFDTSEESMKKTKKFTI